MWFIFCIINLNFFFFLQKQCVKMHMQSIHMSSKVGGTTPPEIKCRRCGYTTFSKKFFHTHMEKKHKVVYQYECEYDQCDHTASRKDVLLNHVKSVHLGIKKIKKKSYKYNKKPKVEPQIGPDVIISSRSQIDPNIIVYKQDPTKLEDTKILEDSENLEDAEDLEDAHDIDDQ